AARGFSCFRAGDFIYFDTYLVPYRDDPNHPGQYLPGPPVADYQWRSNLSTSDAGGVENLQGGAFDPTETGGVELLAINGVPITDVAEPGTLLLCATGIAGIALLRRRKLI